MPPTWQNGKLWTIEVLRALHCGHFMVFTSWIGVVCDSLSSWKRCILDTHTWRPGYWPQQLISVYSNYIFLGNVCECVCVKCRRQTQTEIAWYRVLKFTELCQLLSVTDSAAGGSHAKWIWVTWRWLTRSDSCRRVKCNELMLYSSACCCCLLPPEWT